MTHLDIIKELETAGCLSCSLDGLSQGQGPLASFCPVSAFHSIKSPMLLGKAADEVQFSLCVCPVRGSTSV